MKELAEWAVDFNTFHPLPSLTRILRVAVEVQNDPAYKFRGADRVNEPYCAYQYTLSGHGIFLDATQRYKVTPGRGFLCRCDDPETGYHYPPRGKKPWRFLYVMFQGWNADALVRDITERHGPIHSLSARGPAISRLIAFGRRKHSVRNLSASEGAGIVADVLTELVGVHEQSSAGREDSFLLRLAGDEIQESLGEKLTVATLANRLQVSREHLTRVCQRHLATTPQGFIIMRKMAMARYYLARTSLTVADVAERLGFDDRRAFTAAFKSHHRSPPAAWRRGSRQGENSNPSKRNPP